MASPLVLPALLHSLSHTLGIFTAVLFVQVRGFNVGRGGSIRIIEKAEYHVNIPE